MINWKDPTKELPPLDKTYRCLAEISPESNKFYWRGFCDVFFNSQRGWFRCDSDAPVEVIKWAYIIELVGYNED